MKRVLQAALFAGVFLALPAAASAATLSLSPTSGTQTAGTTFEVKVLLDTSGVATSGTDAYLRFDPTVFQVVDANTSSEGVQVLAGSLYSQTSFNKVDNGAGTITFSGSKTGGSPGYSGNGTLATITFQATKVSSGSPVTFDFTSGSTTDSNVISSSDSTDLLTAVTDANFAVKAASSTPTTKPTDGSDDSDDNDSNDADDSGPNGPGGDGTDSNGSDTVAETGIELGGYGVASLASLAGAGFFLTRKPKRRKK